MPKRILWIDVIRGISILAMVTFHFAFDLMYFGFAKPDLIYQPDWRLFERMIAFSFLFIAGLSLSITHRSSIKWKSFFRRYGVTALCAVLISIVTYTLFNNDMIRFGILHAISVSGLVGLLLLKLNSLSLFLLAVLIFLINLFIPQPLEGSFFWQWAIYTSETPNSLDYRPIIPWITPFILGMASNQLFKKWGLIEMSNTTTYNELSILCWLGRNSLVIYLVHQPILFVGFFLFLQLN
ncbi:MAG: DUF1624 domain-containing protein [Rhodobacteraceae bacterium]|nr:DUF1624 domain-containing protein [Paracoccaceae bacterium]